MSSSHAFVSGPRFTPHSGHRFCFPTKVSPKIILPPLPRRGAVAFEKWARSTAYERLCRQGQCSQMSSRRKGWRKKPNRIFLFFQRVKERLFFQPDRRGVRTARYHGNRKFKIPSALQLRPRRPSEEDLWIASRTVPTFQAPQTVQLFFLSC